MVMIHQLLHQRNIILYYLILLCIMPVQMFVHSEPVEISSKSSFNTKVLSLFSKKVFYNKRIIPVGSVVFNKNSYYTLLYVGGIMVVYTCLIMFPTIYRKPYHYLKTLIKNSKIHSIGIEIKHLGDIAIEYVKHYIEIVLNRIYYKLIYDIYIPFFQLIYNIYIPFLQYLKGLLQVYGDKSSLYYWLINKRVILSNDDDWRMEYNDNYDSSSLCPILQFSRPRDLIPKINSFPKSKKENKEDKRNHNYNHNSNRSNKLHHGTRQKSKVIQLVTNSQAEANVQPNITENRMVMPSNLNSNQTINRISVKSEDTVVNIMDKSVQNNELAYSNSIASSNNTHANTMKLPCVFPRESNIDDLNVVMNCSPYSSKSRSMSYSSLSKSTSINIIEKSIVSSSLLVTFDINDINSSFENTFNYHHHKNNYRMNDQCSMTTMPSSTFDAGHDINSWTINDDDHDREKKIVITCSNSGGSQTENSKNSKGSNEKINGNDSNNNREENNNNSNDNSNSNNSNSNNSNSNSSSGNDGNGNNGNNNNNNNNNNPSTGKGKNKKQKKAAKNANASGTTEEAEGEETAVPSKKKAAKGKKEAKGKNKVAVDTADQSKTSGEIKSPQAAQKKKAAKAAANAKKKEAKVAEESGLLVTGEITYGKAGLQDEPIPTDEEAYNALFSENATYWTPLERTERIRNSPFYDHNHHIAKYGKIKYKPMVEYDDMDINEMNSDMEGDEVNEKGKDKKDKKKKKKANANGASTSDDVEGKKEGSEKKGKKKKANANNREEEDTSNEDPSVNEEKVSKSKKKGKTPAITDSANDSSLESGNEKKSEEGNNKKASKKKKSKTPNANANANANINAKAKMEGLESSSEVEIPPVPAKAKKIKKAKKTAKKSEVSESEDEPEILNSSISAPILSPSNTSTTTITTESHHPMMIYSSSPPALSINQTTYKSNNEDLLNSNNNNNINNNINNINNNNNSTSRSSLMFNKVSQPSPLSSVSYLNYYDDQSIDNNNNNNNNINNNKPTINPLNAPIAQSPIIPIQTPTTPLFGPTTPKMESSTVYSFTNGPSLTISTAPSAIENNNSINNNNNPVQEETIIDLFNRTNKSFRRPRSISLNSHFQPSNEFRSNLSPLLMSTLKNSSALKLDPSPVFPTEQYNNIKLNGMNTTGNNSGNGNIGGNVGSHTIPFQNSLNDHSDSHLYNSNNLSTSYIPPMHSKGVENNKETIPAQTLSPIKSGFNDFNNNKMDNETSPFSLTSPIIKKPTENVIQRYRRARTLSSPAVPPSVDKKNHFYSPFMTGLDIKYDFYIPKSNAVSPLSSSFTAGDSRSFEMSNTTNNREEMTRRRSQSINERNRPNINEF